MWIYFYHIIHLFQSISLLFIHLHLQNRSICLIQRLFFTIIHWFCFPDSWFESLKWWHNSFTLLFINFYIGFHGIHFDTRPQCLILHYLWLILLQFWYNPCTFRFIFLRNILPFSLITIFLFFLTIIDINILFIYSTISTRYRWKSSSLLKLLIFLPFYYTFIYYTRINILHIHWGSLRNISSKWGVWGLKMYVWWSNLELRDIFAAYNFLLGWWNHSVDV